MKTAIFKIFAMATLSVCAFLSCQKNTTNDNSADDASQESSGNTLSEATTDIRFLHTYAAENIAGIFPAYYILYNNWTVVEIRNIDNDCLVFQFVQNSEYGTSELVICGEDMISFVDFDILTGKAANKVIVISFYEDYMRFSELNYDWSTGDYEISGMHQEKIQATKAQQLFTRGGQSDDIADDIAQSFNKMFDKLGNTASLAGHFLAGAPKQVLSILSKVVVPYCKYYLYSYDPEKQYQILNEEISNQGMDYLINISTEDIQMAWEKWSLLRNIKKVFFDDDEEQPTISEDDRQIGWGIFQGYQTYVENLYKGSRFSGEMPYSYDVNAELLSVGETSASISADYSLLTPNSGYISSMGFTYGNKYGVKTDVSVDGFPYTLILEDLSPNTPYEVKAYIKSMGITYADYVEFTTAPVFSVTPTNLCFTQDGGTKGVYVTLTDNVREWDIVEQPQWCKIDKGEASFFVTIEASDVERSGVIILRGYNKEKGYKEATVTVSQEFEKLYQIYFQSGPEKAEYHSQRWWSDGDYTEGWTPPTDSEVTYYNRVTLDRYVHNKSILSLHIGPVVFDSWTVSEEYPSLNNDYETIKSFDLISNDSSSIAFKGLNTRENSSCESDEISYDIIIKGLDTANPIIVYNAVREKDYGYSYSSLLGLGHTLKVTYTYSGTVPMTEIR